MSFGNNDMPPPSKNDFKPPLTVGRISEKKIKTSKLGKLDSFSVYENLLTNSHSLDENSTQKCDPVPAGELDSQSRKQLHPAQKCPYEEPPWGSQPKVEYRLAILKSGAIVGVTKLSKSFSVIGRHQDSDLVMEHPSISRFHAVLQYGKPDPHATDSAKHLGGFYLFDLGSTHGTQLNKQLIDAKSYRRVHVGHHMKFGFSSRTFILEGPVEDEEAESELSVSEIIEFHKERKAKWNRKLETGKAEKEEADRKEDEEEKNTSINWGMGEDATEDDGPISDEDPFALDGADDMNEQLYLDNPKKALRGWFEREGYELEYRVEERGSQQFLCRIELPIATEKASAIVVETSVKGRKKEAVVQCALEACRILDSRGELRKAWHDSHAKKNKNWKEDNYYDSDEDEFFDRTGDLASKREQRKSRLENRIRHVETYDSLKEKLSIAENAIESINKSLKESKTIEAANKVSGDAVDTLDSFMQQLKADHVLDNAKRSQLKLELARLLTERIRLIRLINIVKPTKLPPLRPMRPEITGESSKASVSSSIGSTSSVAKPFGPMVGAMRGRKQPVLLVTGIPAKIMRSKVADRYDGISSSSQTDTAIELRTEIKEDQDNAVETKHLVKDDGRAEKNISEEVLLGQYTQDGREKVTLPTEEKKRAVVNFRQLITTTK